MDNPSYWFNLFQKMLKILDIQSFLGFPKLFSGQLFGSRADFPKLFSGLVLGAA